MSERDADVGGRATVDAGGDSDLTDLFDELEEPETLVQPDAARDQVQETMRVATETSWSGGSFGRPIWGYDRADLTERLVGVPYVADFQNSRVHRPCLGSIPRRSLGVAAGSAWRLARW